MICHYCGEPIETPSIHARGTWKDKHCSVGCYELDEEEKPKSTASVMMAH